MYLVLQLLGMSHSIPLSWLFIMHLHTNDSKCLLRVATNLWICGFWRLSPEGDLYYSKFSDQIILVGCSQLHHFLRYPQWRGIVPSQPSQPLPWNIAALQIVLRKNDPELPIHPRIWKELDTKPGFAGEFVQATGRSQILTYHLHLPLSKITGEFR